MLSYRGLFLGVTISLASIVLADVLVQPGYEHQYNSNPHNLQYQHYQIPSPTKQYHTGQLSNQESTRYVSGVQTIYPYESYQDNARSNMVTYHTPYHRYLPHHHVHYAKIGGHGYRRPSVLVGYPIQSQPLTVPQRYKRSEPTNNPNSIESNKSEIVEHDNDVAAKSPLTDTEHPTTVDSLLPEHEPTDTNDKRVKNRQVIGNPYTFHLVYPENAYEKFHVPESLKKIKITPPEYPLGDTYEQPQTTQDPPCYMPKYQRIFCNKPSFRQIMGYPSPYGPRSQYRDALAISNFHEPSFKPMMMNEMKYFWPGYGMHVDDSTSELYEDLDDDYHTMERAAHQGLNKESLQDITSMNTPRSHIPSYPEKSSRIYHCAEMSDAAPLSRQSQQLVQPFNEQSNLDHYAIAPPYHHHQISPNNHPNFYPGKYLVDDANLYDLKERNSHSADDIKHPAISK